MKLPLDTHRPILRKDLLVATLLAAVGFFLLGFGAIRLTPQDSPIAIIWPANAFALCLMLRYARNWRDNALMLAAIFIGDLCGNGFGAGSSWVLTVGYSLANTLEIGVCLALIGKTRALRFSSVRAGMDFAFRAGVVPPLVGGGAAILVTILGGANDAFAAGCNWVFADVLGFCIIFPIGMTISWRQIEKLRLPQRLPLAIGSVTLLLAVTVLVYPLQHYSLQFLILPAALFLTARFRVLGAGTAMIIITAVILADPMPPKSDPTLRIQYLQLFVAVCSLVCVRAAGLLNQRDLQRAIIERRHRRAVRASRFKSQLLAHVSHEARSPLSAIIGFSSMLESGSLTAQRAPEFAAIIAHNGELLQRLHDDLLDLSRAEAGALTIQAERVPVGPTLATCISGIRLDATLGGKEVLVDGIADALAVQADPVRLAQILNNLIANAFKYGDNFSPIRVSAHAREDGFGRIEIANTGPGIPVAERGAVFLPFRRAQGVGRSVPGAGLGLSIAKLLVEAQGGRIDFESEPGRQTRFWIDLPLAA